MFVTSHGFYDISVVIVTFIVISVLYINYKYTYWKRKGIIQLKPTFPTGNYGRKCPRGIAIGAITRKYYDELKQKGCKFGGVYLGLSPYLVVVDPTYAKDILTKDFQYFTDRVMFYNSKDPFTVHISSQTGSDWKNTRNKFTSMFTPLKIKNYYESLEKCTKDFREKLKELADNNSDVDIFETMACFTTDVISSVLFGIEAHSFKPSQNVFRKMGRDTFAKFSYKDRVALFLTFCYPNVARIMNMGNIQAHVQDFFLRFVKEAVEYRRKNNIYRPDFLQMLIEMQDCDDQFTYEYLTSQAFLIFAAGFQTSATTTSFALFELGSHIQVQNKLRTDINTVISKHNGKVTYEALQEMTFLDQIFFETARKYPLLATLTRVCVKNYTFENSDVSIEKGTGVFIPLIGYHRDPQYFLDPLKWDPSRFNDKSEKHQGYFPFGDGPRHCIGSRLGLLVVKMSLATILLDYEVSVNPSTETPLELDELTFLLKTKNPILVKLTKI